MAAGCLRSRHSGPTIAEAQTRAYEAVDAIDWPGGFCRRDIGWRAVGTEETGLRLSAGRLIRYHS